MITTSRLLGAALISAACAGVAIAQAPLLAPQLGLWEMTTMVSVGNAMPAIDTSNMPPEQKARIEAAMKGMSADRTDVSKTCFRKEDLADPNFMMRGQQGMTCTQKLNTNTRTVLDADVVCTGERAMSGHTHIELPTPTTMRATMKTQSPGGRAGAPTPQVSITMSGKWLAADCGKEG